MNVKSIQVTIPSLSKICLSDCIPFLFFIIDLILTSWIIRKRINELINGHKSSVGRPDNKQRGLGLTAGETPWSPPTQTKIPRLIGRVWRRVAL